MECITSTIKLNSTMLKSSLCGNSDAYILVKGTITVLEPAADKAAKRAGERNKKLFFNWFFNYFSIFQVIVWIK